MFQKVGKLCLKTRRVEFSCRKWRTFLKTPRMNTVTIRFQMNFKNNFDKNFEPSPVTIKSISVRSSPALLLMRHTYFPPSSKLTWRMMSEPLNWAMRGSWYTGRSWELFLPAYLYQLKHRSNVNDIYSIG